MDAKPKRRWLQLHLSTAVVLMFVAGGLLAINLCPVPLPLFGELYGCPVPFVETALRLPNPRDQRGRVIEFSHIYKITRGPFTFSFAENGWSYSAFCLDFLTWLAILLIVTLSCEWLLRRYEAKKT